VIKLLFSSGYFGDFLIKYEQVEYVLLSHSTVLLRGSDPDIFHADPDPDKEYEIFAGLDPDSGFKIFEDPDPELYFSQKNLFLCEKENKRT